MAGRKPGTKNKTHTQRTEQVTLKIAPQIKNEWKAFCAVKGVKMSDRLEELVLLDLQQSPAQPESDGEK